MCPVPFFFYYIIKVPAPLSPLFPKVRCRPAGPPGVSVSTVRRPWLVTAQTAAVSRAERFPPLLNGAVPGRPSRLYFAEKMTRELGGAKIYLKREDLNHTGAHKINHVLRQALSFYRSRADVSRCWRSSFSIASAWGMGA